MKELKLISILLFAFLLNLHALKAQEQESVELSLDKGTINNQFEYIYKKSGNYRADGKRYEVVRVISLDKLRKNVADSLVAYSKKEESLKSTIASQEATIASLNKNLSNTTSNLENVTEEKDSMSFLGMLVSKTAYNTILWSVIAGLLGLLLFFIYKFRNSNILTQEAKNSLSEVEIEYENHRRRALEREQKISRQLQDEINKHRKA